MDIQRFFDRIGYTGGTERTAENLQQLIRCHLEAVPFENLDYYNSPKEGSLRPEDLYDKVVTRRRGGICFELNGLFYWLLKELGYECYPLGVRIMMRGDGPAPITHQGNIAIIDGKKYYCDVGFGGPGPKGLLSLEEEGIQIIDKEPFQVVKDGIHYKVLRRHEDQMVPVLGFADVAFDPADFPMMLFFMTVNPQSYFVIGRMINLCCPDGYLALTGNEFTSKHGDEVVRKVLESEEEVRLVLEKEFGLVV